VLEQQLAERFRVMVDNEPPFVVAPDELADRLIRAHRRLWWRRRHRPAVVAGGEVPAQRRRQHR
jgi:hypothetical protein